MAKDQNKLKLWIEKTNFKYGTNATILIISVIVVAVLFNVLVDSMNLQADLTPNKLYSISEKTEDVLVDLDKDVQIYGLFDETAFRQNERDRTILELLDKYGKYDHVTINYVDPSRDPSLVKSLDPNDQMQLKQNDFVVKSGTKTKKVPYDTLYETEMDPNTFQTVVTGSVAEEKFTGAVRFVTADVTPHVYFLTGHGEYDLNSEFKMVKQTLENNNYVTGSLNLLTEKEIPDNTSILIVASPKKDITENERKVIMDYVLNGGNMMLMVDALNTDPEFPQFEQLLQEFNLGMDYDQIKENNASRHVPKDQYTLIPIVADNEINAALNPKKFAMIMPKSRSIRILKNEKEYMTMTPLLWTSEKAIGEPITEGRDEINGPLSMAVAVDYKGGYKPAKVVVMGNANFIKDDYIYAYQQYSLNSFYFFANTLFWMRNDDDSIYIKAKSFETAMLTMTQQQAKIVGVVCMVGLPLLILIIGFIVFLRRRHL